MHYSCVIEYLKRNTVVKDIRSYLKNSLFDKKVDNILPVQRSYIYNILNIFNLSVKLYEKNKRNCTRPCRNKG